MSSGEALGHALKPSGELPAHRAPRRAVLCMHRAAVAATAAALVLTAAACAPPSIRYRPERIAFTTFRPGDLDLFIRETSGAPLRRLTDDAALDLARDEDPALSPDGRWVVFCSERNGNPDLYAIDLQSAGRRPQLLIESNAMEAQPGFSPDGRRIAFVGTAEGNAEIYVMAFRPETPLRMSDATNVTHSPAGEFRPAFSPDGSRITFSSDRDSPATGPSVARQRKGEIYVMRANGDEPRRLTRSPEWNGSPAWLPDGTTIVFSAATIDLDAHVMGRTGVTARLMMIPAEGGEAIPLVTAAGNSASVAQGAPSTTPGSSGAALSPAILPDGRIAYAWRAGSGAPGRGWTIRSVAARATASDAGKGTRTSTNVSVPADDREEIDPGTSCWDPTFSASGQTMVCTGPGRAPTGPPAPFAQLLGEGPLMDAYGPFTRPMLPDRWIALAPLRAVTAAVHPREDLVARTDAPADADLNHPESFDSHLVVSTPDGKGARVLHRFARGQDPGLPLVWSSDGSWLGFMAGAIFGAPDAEADVWKIGFVSPNSGAGSHGAVDLTPDSPGNDGFADVSEDGARIVFRSGRTGNFDIFLAAADGSGVRNLTNHPANDTFPAISPRGDLVAFCSDRDGDPDPVTGRRTFEIYTLEIDEDGNPGALRRLTTSPGQDAHPRFSPDGEWVLFTSERGGMNDEEPLIKSVVFAPQAYGELYAQRLRDGLVVRLTHNAWEDGMSSWAGPLAGRHPR